jgi:hypothetical protein
MWENSNSDEQGSERAGLASPAVNFVATCRRGCDVSCPAYGLDQLRTDLGCFDFLLGGNDGEPFFQPGP